MLQLIRFSDNSLRPRWVTPPWTCSTPSWLDIDQRLPPDHLARQIDLLVAELDLTDFERSYAGLGSLPYPPDLLVRLVLFENQRGRLSPAQWFEDCQFDETVKWLLFGLRPSRSCLYKFRDRVGPYLDQWNRQILKTARAEGRTPAKRASVDGTFTAAYASRHRLINAKTLATRSQQLDEAVAVDFASQPGEPPIPVPDADSITAPAAGAHSPQAGGIPDPVSTLVPPPPPEPTPSAGAPPPATAAAAAPSAPTRPYWMAGTPAGRFRQRQDYHQAQNVMTQRQNHRKKTMSRRAKAKRQSPERMKISPTEPETVLGFDKTNVFRPLYNIQFACDLDSRFILGSGVFMAATDANLFGPLMERTHDLSGTTPDTVLNDPQYANVLNLKICDDDGITMYAPVANDPPQPEKPPPPLGSSPPAPDGSPGDPPRSEKPTPLIPKSRFTWLPEQQTYRCPEGHLLVLQRRGTDQREDGELKQSQYRCPAEHCRNCPLRDQCTRSPERGRMVKRSEHDDLYDALRQRMRQPEGQALYKLRKQTVERQFADLKQHRALREFASFGLARARIQVGLLVLAHNGLELLKVRSQGAESGTAAHQAG